MIVTTFDKSKHLLELGLDPDSADMYYTGHRSIHNPKEIEYTQEPRVRTKFVSFDRLEVFFPAWSLSALLEVMPITITKDGMEYKLKVFPSGLFSTHSDTSKWTLQYCGIDYSYKSRDKYPILVKVTQHDLIFAAYEMVCWLLENKLIKKGDNNE